ncbi:hypothetical protein HNR46_004111 [Haloferula luteola]|uniref:Uncharacterized protein n=1 Tax=Haloferula luteola TaxID=595692 RepID=A0A840V6F8_9BACT|nr:hypothetical protein [Haloferula luteola]MBB5353847.1 hypothetical protein [Haloferula luteola]
MLRRPPRLGDDQGAPTEKEIEFRHGEWRVEWTRAIRHENVIAYFPAEASAPAPISDPCDEYNSLEASE